LRLGSNPEGHLKLKSGGFTDLNFDVINWKEEGQKKTFIHKTQLNEYIEEAKKAEFKDQKSKALDKYQEALYFLQNDEIDDSLQKENIDELKAKISELT